MKHAIVTTEGRILRIKDTAQREFPLREGRPQRPPEDWILLYGNSIVAISNAKAEEAQALAIDTEIPPVMDGEEVLEEGYTRKADKVFIIGRKVKTGRAIDKAVRDAERAEMDARFAEAEANRVPVLGAVKKYTFHKRLKALGKWAAFNDEIKKTDEIKDLYDNSHELDINDPDVIALSPLIKVAVGVTDEEYDSLFEV